MAYDWTAIADLPLTVIFDYINHALEKEKERKAWDLWTSLYPKMITGQIKFKSFTEFKNSLFSPIIRHTPKTTDEIEEEMSAIINNYEKKKGINTPSL